VTVLTEVREPKQFEHMISTEDVRKMDFSEKQPLNAPASMLTRFDPVSNDMIGRPEQPLKHRISRTSTKD
jgi:hypothetical protein